MCTLKFIFNYLKLKSFNESTQINDDKENIKDNNKHIRN